VIAGGRRRSNLLFALVATTVQWDGCGYSPWVSREFMSLIEAVALTKTYSGRPEEGGRAGGDAGTVPARVS
jgi:hypothetical protein